MMKVANALTKSSIEPTMKVDNRLGIVRLLACQVIVDVEARGDITSYLCRGLEIRIKSSTNIK